MKTPDRRSTQKMARIRLAALTRRAWEHTRSAMATGNALAAARAEERLRVLNRALAILALHA